MGELGLVITSLDALTGLPEYWNGGLCIDLGLSCLLAAPEGIRHFCEMPPDVPLYTAGIDEHLDEHGYIILGLGDAGDRLFGTK